VRRGELTFIKTVALGEGWHMWALISNEVFPLSGPLFVLFIDGSL